jgi:hypothetical protein
VQAPFGPFRQRCLPLFEPHGDPRLVLGQAFDRVAGANLAFLQDGEIDPRLPGLQEGFDHAGVAETDPELETRHPRLRDDQPGRPDAQLVADVDRVVEQSLRRQGLAEDPRRQHAAESLTP